MLRSLLRAMRESEEVAIKARGVRKELFPRKENKGDGGRELDGGGAVALMAVIHLCTEEGVHSSSMVGEAHCCHAQPSQIHHIA